ncbi:MAG: cupin domain-containing protein [Candidatus Omnitrophica bacterium]|nr:cupin domain-containing protein [Candidatus Omnitrophota bacterium]
MAENETIKNLFSQIPDRIPEEIFNTLFETDGLKIERIISNGHSTAKDQWLEQNRSEWVLVVQGSAELLFQEPVMSVMLKAGDYVLIPAHCKHRVAWTAANQKTVWLAVHGQEIRKQTVYKEQI